MTKRFVQVRRHDITPEARAEVERLYGGPLRPEFPHFMREPSPPCSDPHAPEIFLAEDGSRWAMPPISHVSWLGSPRYSGPGERIRDHGSRK